MSKLLHHLRNELVVVLVGVTDDVHMQEIKRQQLFAYHGFFAVEAVDQLVEPPLTIGSDERFAS